MISVEEFDKLYLKSDEPNAELVDNHFMVIRDTIFAFEFSDAVVERLKNDKSLNSIHIMPVMPKNLDPYYDTYEERLTELIKHIIFHDQRCVDGLMIISNDADLVAKSKSVVEKNSRVISSTGNRFPTVESTVFDQGFANFHATVTDNYNTAYWYMCNIGTETDATMINGSKYEVIIHKWEMYIKKVYMKQNGSFYSSMPLGTTITTAYYYEKGRLLPMVDGGMS
jgi:hypothetical protein